MSERIGFRLDLNRCTGCQACELACLIENDLPLGGAWRRVEDFNAAGHEHAPAFHLSLACNHCEAAPCATACPANAFRRDEATGALLIDASACIGCRYCSWACPFDAPRFDASTRTMGKCTLCQPRLLEGRRPACVEICPTGALDAGGPADMAAGGALASVPGFPPSDAQPRLRILPLRPGARRPDPDGGAFDGDPPGPPTPPGPPGDGGRRLSLRTEWPLLLFTWAAPFLVALKLDTLPTCRLDRPWPILIGGLFAMALSSAHLGRPRCAWRALLGLRHSWLSREIAAFGLFVLLAGALPLLLPPTLPLPLSLAAALAGLFALHAMDRVYEVALRRPGIAGLNGVDALPTALLYTVALRGWGWLLLGLLGLKLLLWAARQRDATTRSPVALAGPRLVLGLALPTACVLMGQPTAGPVMLAALLAGELAERADFYRGLRLPSPRRELALALASGTGRSSGN